MSVLIALVLGLTLGLCVALLAIKNPEFLTQYRVKEKYLSDYLPWAFLQRSNVVVQKGGFFQKTLAFRGPDLESSSAQELQSSASRLNNALKRLGRDWTFFCEAQRFKTNDYTTCEWPNAAAWVVDEERRGQFEGEGDHYDSNYFLTLVWKVPEVGEKRAEALFIEDPNRDHRDKTYDVQRDLDFFIKTVGNIEGILGEIFPEVMPLDDDETLTYLHSTISTRRHPVKAPETPIFLDHILCDETYQSGQIPVLGDHYVMTATINDFPSEAWPGILDELNHLPIEYRWSSRFICLDHQDAKTIISKYRKRWVASIKSLFTMLREQASGTESRLINTEAVGYAADAEAALEELGSKHVSFGYYTATITVWHTDLDDCHKRLDAITKVINSRGFTTRAETHNSFHAWLSSLPGHVHSNPRRQLINTLNLAHLFPLSAIWSGPKHDEHLAQETGKALPLAVCNTTGNTPFRLSLGIGDVGHTFIVGPTGSGKSTLLGLLALQWLRYPKARVVFFDKDRTARAATMAVNGSIYEPGNEDRPVAFQPLANIDEPSELVWAQLWLETVLALQNITLTPTDKIEIRTALQALSTSPKHQRTIGGLENTVQNTEIRAALKPYTLDGTFGQLFDSDHESLRDEDWIMIEMGALMDLGDKAVIPALIYIFHRIEALFHKNRPTLLILDEAWLFMGHPFFAERIKQWLKTLRKQNVYVVFASQEIEDATASSICSTLLSACKTKIFLPDSGAMEPLRKQAYVDLGLSDTEILNLSNAVEKKHYFYSSPLGKRMFDLELGGVALAFVGRSAPSDHALMDRLVKNHPAQEWAENLLIDRGLDWAAQLLKKDRAAKAS